jgi:hypothetical protein
MPAGSSRCTVLPARLSVRVRAESGALQLAQLMITPFVRLNVEGVQKLAALRYHTW